MRRKLTLEHRRKLSLAALRMSEADRKARAAKAGKARWSARKQSRSDCMKAQWADPASRAKLINGMRAAKGKLPPVDTAKATHPIFKRILDTFIRAIGL